MRRSAGPGSDDAARFFDRFSSGFDTLYDDKRGPLMRRLDRRFRSDMFIRFALTFEALGDLRDKTVVDIGCGSGPYVLEALKRGAAHVTGLDPAEGMLGLARVRVLGTPFEAKTVFVKSLFPGASLEPHDFAIVMGVLDYVADPQAFLDALRPLVRQRAAVSFPSRHWLRTPLRKARYYMRNCPVYFYDETTIRTLGRAAGFRKVDVRKIHGAGLDYHVCLEP
jgi:2-polyprenyl-3-methyl-5-hydroxy-6-metoxy-1,4-benzoquinol methylase